jgi:uncharacterized membrane protein YfcA
MSSLALPSLLCLIGLLVGVLSGLLGIGGGLLVYPLLLTVATWFPEMGLDWHSLSGLAVTQSLAASSAATVVHWHSRQSRLDLILRLGVGCLIGGYLGGYTSAWVPAPLIRWTLIVWLLLVLGLTLKRVKPKAPSADQLEVLSGDDGRVYGAVRRQSATVIAWQTALGLVIGYVSGVIGIGGGALLVPLMMHLYGAPMRLAAGSTMVVVFLQSILAFSGKFQVGLVPLHHAWIQAVGAVTRWCNRRATHGHRARGLDSSHFFCGDWGEFASGDFNVFVKSPMSPRIAPNKKVATLYQSLPHQEIPSVPEDAFEIMVKMVCISGQHPVPCR